MKNILVPFDFSEYAEAALDFALELSQVTRGEVTVLNVIEYPLASTFDISDEMGQFNKDNEIFTLELIKKAKIRLQELTDSAKYNTTSFTTHLMIGNPYEGITKYVEIGDTDLIIMGTKGATGLQEIFVGSNAEKIVRNSSCPVLTIHKEQKFKEIKNIVFATNLDNTQGYILDKFKELQRLFDSTIHLVWVHTPHDVINEDLAFERLEEIAIDNHLTNYEVHVTKGFYPEEGILMYAWNINANLIGLATHSFKGLAHLFMGSVAEDIVNHATIPVWTLSMKAIPETVS